MLFLAQTYYTVKLYARMKVYVFTFCVYTHPLFSDKDDDVDDIQGYPCDLHICPSSTRDLPFKPI